MTKQEQQITKLAQGGCPVFYFYSADAFLVRQSMAAARRVLQQEDSETTVLDGPAPELEQVIMAAGTISFFGTRRIVELPELDPAAYSDKDLDAFCDALASAENAVFVLGSVFAEERGKLKLGKRAQKLIAKCKELGLAEERARLRPAELRTMCVDRAADAGTQLSDTAATALLDRCGSDPLLLENEVDKLCAFSGYTAVTPAMVAELSVQTLDADVFDMVRMITARNAAGACGKLHTLLRLQNEPIQITGALIGSYVDLYRVKLGLAAKRGSDTVFKDFAYRGSPYRLKKSAETAQRYTLPQLENCLAVLAELDKGLKGSPVDNTILMETALCRLAAVGGGASRR